MLTKKIALIAAITAAVWFAHSSTNEASAQVSVQFGTPTYYGNGPTYRGGTYYGLPQSYPTYNAIPTQRYSSGYRGNYVSPTYRGNSYYGNSYQSYRPNYYGQPVYGYGQPIYGNNFNYGYSTPSQARGAIVGGAIGNAVGGTRGGNVGAAIGAAVQSR